MYNRAVKSLVLVPEMQRTDHGNEIAIMTASHCTLRQNADAEHLLQISVLKISGYISVALLPVV